jgi:acetyl-CoA acetyltransferase family protein
VTAAYVIDACRTPIGRVKGALAPVRPDDLAAHVLSELLLRNGWLRPELVEDVYFGAANQAGEDNRNVARMAVLLAGLPVEVPGATVNRLCGSGMEAVIQGARAIAAGEADIVIAGGSESMTRAPFVLPRSGEPWAREATVADTRLGWRLVNPAMRAAYPPITLGETAEEVAQRYGIGRDVQDSWALASHRKAAAARDQGAFDAEIVPIEVDGVKVTCDESIRAGLTAEDLAGKRPAFRAGGTVTGGNSSPLNDGAAALLVVSERVVREQGLEPLGRYVGGATAGVHPDVMGIGPVPATRRALSRAGWDTGDLEVVEANEAFAAQTVAVVRELGLDPDRVNPHGGAIALGHPLGCSGARIVTTLLHGMRGGGASRGAATMCIGVGQGITTLWEST